jgi:hypothetical protein
MATIELNDRYSEFVNSTVRAHFAERGIEMSQRAQDLITFTMQCQIEEQEMGEDRLLSTAEWLLGNSLAESYLRTYGRTLLTFNRAFHLLADVGRFTKFPFGPTRPFAK